MVSVRCSDCSFQRDAEVQALSSQPYKTEKNSNSENGFDAAYTDNFYRQATPIRPESAGLQYDEANRFTHCFPRQFFCSLYLSQPSCVRNILGISHIPRIARREHHSGERYVGRQGRVEAGHRTGIACDLRSELTRN